ncbi:hypothetical protein DIPPA_23432 [Diplonema papillatum]|nr:hypothetical protein DIPPA_23432 [Diplonema papillatum]
MDAVLRPDLAPRPPKEPRDAGATTSRRELLLLRLLDARAGGTSFRRCYEEAREVLPRGVADPGEWYAKPYVVARCRVNEDGWCKSDLAPKLPPRDPKAASFRKRRKPDDGCITVGQPYPPKPQRYLDSARRQATHAAVRSVLDTDGLPMFSSFSSTEEFVLPPLPSMRARGRSRKDAARFAR